METSIPVLAVADRNHAGFGPKFMDDLPARSARRGRGLGWGVEHEAFQPNRFFARNDRMGDRGARRAI